MNFASELVGAVIGSQFGSAVPNSPADKPRMTAMPAALFSPSFDVSSLSREEVASLELDVHKEALKLHLADVMYRLTGPDPKPVFLPQIDPRAQNIVGLLLTPYSRPKMAPKA